MKHIDFDALPKNMTAALQMIEELRAALAECERELDRQVHMKAEAIGHYGLAEQKIDALRAALEKAREATETTREYLRWAPVHIEHRDWEHADHFVKMALAWVENIDAALLTGGGGSGRPSGDQCTACDIVLEQYGHTRESASVIGHVCGLADRSAEGCAGQPANPSPSTPGASEAGAFESDQGMASAPAPGLHQQTGCE